MIELNLVLMLVIIIVLIVGTALIVWLDNQLKSYQSDNVIIKKKDIKGKIKQETK